MRKSTSAKQKAQRKPIDKKIPYHYKPDGMSTEVWQKELRKQFATTQLFKIENIGGHPVYSDFKVYNAQSGNTYKVSIRNEKSGYNFCTCPDFKVNTLGTCKHIEYVLQKLRTKRGYKKYFAAEVVPSYSSVFLHYGEERKVFMRIGSEFRDQYVALAEKYFDNDFLLKESAYDKIENFINEALEISPEFRCYDDAINFIIEKRERHQRIRAINELIAEDSSYSWLENLLNVSLYPYQKEGICFAAKAGRCLIADDMGLGKTIQAIGAAEVMNQKFGAEKILILCPTSLKYQWKQEIARFTNKEALVIEGLATERWKQYREVPNAYKIVSFNTIKTDWEVINECKFDLIILDEAQRIKNWQTKTAQYIKQLISPYAIVLTGTPIENKLDELHSIIGFIDRYKLGPLFKFLDKHRITNETGKITGYKDLNKISELLSEVMIRRTKKQVLKQLPERIDKNIFVDMTSQQSGIHEEYQEMVAKLVDKWKRFRFLSEKDRQSMLIALSCMRMVSDSTYILDEKTRHDTKIEELMEVLNGIFEQNEKVVIFSQWERMTRLVAWELDKKKVFYQSLHGAVPSPKRKDLLRIFKEDEKCKVFLSTDAGGVGLNLQNASFVINLDIPWNPAVLEQRIARVHRLGQQKKVQVINFVSTDSIEHRMLDVLKFKKGVFEGVLDNGQSQIFLDDYKFNGFMNNVVSLTEQPESPKEDIPVTAAPLPDIIMQPVNEAVIQPPVRNTSPANGNSTTAKTPPEVALSEVFVSGLAFLQKLGTALNAVQNGEQAAANPLIGKDPATGQMHLKIPLPDNNMLQQIAEVFKKLAPSAG